MLNNYELWLLSEVVSPNLDKYLNNKEKITEKS